jgi:hypothetical protein
MCIGESKTIKESTFGFIRKECVGRFRELFHDDIDRKVQILVTPKKLRKSLGAAQKKWKFMGCIGER